MIVTRGYGDELSSGSVINCPITIEIDAVPLQVAVTVDNPITVSVEVI